MIKSGCEAILTGPDEPIAHAEDSKYQDFGKLDWEQQKCLQWARIMERFRESIACEREATIATLDVDPLMNAEQSKKEQATPGENPDARQPSAGVRGLCPGLSAMLSRKPHRPRSSGFYI